MNKVTSKDGTEIAYDLQGQGPVVILVDGALCYRASGPSGPLAAILASDFTVVTYDRRGRGDSGDKKPYAVEREIEDIEALIDAVGGSAFVYGISSGAALAAEAANKLGSKIKKLALYEAPFIVDDTRSPIPDDFMKKLQEAVAANRRSHAVKMFMKLVGVPAAIIPLMPLMPGWSKGTVVAHTLPYDITLVQDYEHGKPLPTGHWSSVTMPTLVAAGGKSPAWMQNAMKEFAKALPAAKHLTVEGQTHMLKASVIAPILKEFFAGKR